MPKRNKYQPNFDFPLLHGSSTMSIIHLRETSAFPMHLQRKFQALEFYLLHLQDNEHRMM